MCAEAVAVVIPTHNRGEQILGAVRSAERQSHKPAQIIVVVDGSSDNTCDLLHDYWNVLPLSSKRRLRIYYQNNRGVSAARNSGVQASNCEYVALLDDDDFWHPEKLARQMLAVRSQAAAKPILCTTDFVAVRPGISSSELVECASCMTLPGQILMGAFPPPSSWLFSRNTFEAAGGFDEALHAGEDVDFVTKLRRIDATFLNVAGPMTYYTDSPGKVYRDQEAAAARVLLRHHAWWENVLSENDYEAIMQWYRMVLTPQTYYEISEQLQRARSCTGRCVTD